MSPVCFSYSGIGSAAARPFEIAFLRQDEIVDFLHQRRHFTGNAVLNGFGVTRSDRCDDLLLRQAELVNVLLGAYTSGVDTTWPDGRPPYSSTPSHDPGKA